MYSILSGSKKLLSKYCQFVKLRVVKKKLQKYQTKTSEKITNEQNTLVNTT